MVSSKAHQTTKIREMIKQELEKYADNCIVATTEDHYVEPSDLVATRILTKVVKSLTKVLNKDEVEKERDLIRNCLKGDR